MNGLLESKCQITVQFDKKLEDLKWILNSNEFVLKQEYDINDVYLVDSSIDLNGDVLDILNNCVLVRNIINGKNNENRIIYKLKEYGKNQEITKYEEATCDVFSVDEAKNFLTVIGYNELMKISDHVFVYTNGIDEFHVQYVNEKYVFIEVDDHCTFINKTYRDENEIIESLRKYDFPFKDNDYYAKKAVVTFNELYRNSEE